MKAATWLGLTTGIGWAIGLAFHHGTVGLAIGIVAGLVLATTFRSRKRAGDD